MLLFPVVYAEFLKGGAYERKLFGPSRRKPWGFSRRRAGVWWQNPQLLEATEVWEISPAAEENL